MTKFKSLLLVALLLISSGAMASDLIQLDSLKYCKKCVVNFPDDYIGPENSYFLSSEMMFKEDPDSLDGESKFIGLDSVKKVLASIGITDYEIITKEYNSEGILFRVLTNDPKRIYIESAFGGNGITPYWMIEENSYFFDCQVQTFKEAEEKFKSVGFDDISKVDFNFTPITDYNENKLTLNMCVEAIPDKK